MSENRTKFAKIGTRQNPSRVADKEANSEINASLKGALQDIEERKKYAQLIFWLVVGWLAVVVLILIVHGVRWPWMAQYVGFNLSEAVLIALITTTTGGVVGLLLIVVRYLFHQQQRKFQKKSR